MTTTAGDTTAPVRRSPLRLGTFGPLIALALLIVLGAVLNDHFLTIGNLSNIVARASFMRAKTLTERSFTSKSCGARRSGCQVFASARNAACTAPAGEPWGMPSTSK